MRSLQAEATAKFIGDAVLKTDAFIAGVLSANAVKPEDVQAWERQSDGTVVFHHNGKPLIKLWPMETKTETVDGSIIMTASQNYKVYTHEDDA